MNKAIFCLALTTAGLASMSAAQAGVINRYLMDDGSGTTVSDSVGTNDGTVKGGTGGWTTGKFGGALDTGADKFVSFPAAGIPMNQGTFVQWVKLGNSPAAPDWSNPLTNHLLDSQANHGSAMRHEIHSSGNLNVYSVPNGAAADTATIATSKRIRDNYWHQLVTTYDVATNTAVAYVDGIEVGSTGLFDTTGVTLASTWRLARRDEGGGSISRGVYDNTAVYDRALDANEVNALFYRARDGVSLGTVTKTSHGLRHLYVMDYATHQGGTGAYDSRDGYDGTVTGGSWADDDPPQNHGGWQSTASNQWVQLPMRVNLLEGTYEGWFKTATGVADWQNPLATSIRAINEAHANDSMRIEVVTSAQYGPRLMVYDAPGAGSFGVTGFSSADDQWHHLALTYEQGSPVKLYVDGELAAQSSSVYDALQAYDRGFTMLGARAPGATTGWRGTVGTVGYYDIALSDLWIREHFQNGISANVPEPASVLLLALGGLGLLGTILRRRARSRRG